MKVSFGTDGGSNLESTAEDLWLDSTFNHHQGLKLNHTSPLKPEGGNLVIWLEITKGRWMDELTTSIYPWNTDHMECLNTPRAGKDIA